MSSRDAAYRNPIRIEYVDWLDPRAVALREAMDAETSAMYAAFASGQSAEVTAAIADALTVDPAEIVTTIIAVDGEEPVGHSALRPYGTSLEVKKVFVAESVRGRGVARLLMGELEAIGREVVDLAHRWQVRGLRRPVVLGHGRDRDPGILGERARRDHELERAVRARDLAALVGGDQRAGRAATIVAARSDGTQDPRDESIAHTPSYAPAGAIAPDCPG